MCMCLQILTEWIWDGSGVSTFPTKEVPSESNCICSGHLVPGDSQSWFHTIHPTQGGELDL